MTAFLATLALLLGQFVWLAPSAQAANEACAGGVLNVVAHTDDDLIFTSPDLLADVTAKRCVRTLFLTAGDAGYEDDYWPRREQGIEAAYAYMAGVSNSWSTSTLSLAGKSVRLRTLNGAPAISVAYMRLPDGNVLGGGTARRGYQSIKRLLDGSISSISAIDGSASYTATTLRNAVLDAMRSNGSTVVRTQDYVSNYGADGDHYDHHATGYVTQDASGSYGSNHQLRSYLGYDSSTWAANVSGTNLTRKRTAFYNYYAPYDDEVSQAEYDGYGWLERQYVIASSGPTVVANAGPDRSVAAGTLVTLDATGTSSTGTISYSWAQTAGTTVSLSGATSAKPTFTPTVAGTYTFRVTATTGSSTSTDTVNVTVTSADSGNVARLTGVTVTASSQDAAQPAARVVDGSVLGWPDDETKEWATVGGGAGSWVQLAWPNAVRVDRVVLYDRPNDNDRVLSGTLTFSDGSTVAVGNLANAGPTTITFPARATSNIRFTVNSVSSATENIGLAEFEVYGALDKAPVANAGPDQSVNVGTQVTLDGSASSDPDAGTTLTYAWAKTSGPAATLSNATVAKPTFTPTAAGTYVFELTVSDGALTAKDSVTITVTGTNQAPTANAGPDQSVTTGTLVTLDGSASSDPNAGTTLTYAWAKTSGPAATLSSTTVAKPTFTPASVGTYVFTLTVSDGSLTATDTVSITVAAANQAPTANAGPDQSVTSGTLVTLDGSASSDPNAGTTLTYAWVRTSGPAAVTLSNATAQKPTFTPTTTGTYVFTLTVSDGSLTATDTVSITVTAANQAPTANAGPDQSVTSGTLVTLDGSGSSDPNGTAVTYAWVRTSGPAAVTLSNATAQKPTFTPTTTGTYVFTLTVSDGALTDTDTVSITVTAPANQAPSANAGPDQSVTTGTQVTLDGSGSSDPNGTAVTYAWAKTGGTGPAVTLSSATAQKPTFTPTVAGTYVFTLTVSDGSLTDTDTVTIAVGQANQAPSSNAGPDQSVTSGTQVTLDGSGSTDPDAGTTLTYAWAKTGGTGPAVTLSNATAQKPTFTPTTTGTYVFTLTVSDGTLTDTDTVTITVTAPANQAPSANAGPDQSVTTGTLVTLDGSGSSDPNGTAVTYAWAKTGGTGPAVTLSNATAQKPTFTPTTTGTYVFTLTVSDGALTDTDTVTITVTAANQAPTANAGPDQSVTTGTLVTLDGSGSSDPNGTALTYAWVKTSGPAATLSSTTVAKPTFTPASVGTYVFALTVSDGSLTATDTVSITVTAANQAPTANAGPDQSVPLNTVVTLDGSGSSDPNGTALTYAWVKTSGPAATLSSTTVAKPTFTPNSAGTYVFELTVSDGSLTAKDSVTVVAQSSTNVARLAGVTVTQSSQNTSTSQLGTKAVDGVVAGYPGDYTKEWATSGGKAGSWIQLTWSSAVQIDRVVLYDRPNTNDRILGGTLVFSDGSQVSVPSLDNAGAATTITFATRTVTSVRLNITSVASTTQNVGLAEFEVWGTSSSVPVNRAPVASAGADQAVTTGSVVTLDGSGSSDPDPGTTLTYAWSKTSGPAVTLSSASVVKPTFTAATVGTYVFSLTVSDGALSHTDSVTVTVTAAASVNVARLPGVTVTQSSQNTSTSQLGTKAIDGVVAGYPGDYTKEWATSGGKAGSWIKLAWASPTSVNRIVLYDRPNTNDQVTAATLVFSDGSQVTVPALDNAGGATTITFPARTVTSVQLNITSVSSATQNIGLSEFEVWEAV